MCKKCKRWNQQQKTCYIGNGSYGNSNHTMMRKIQEMERRMVEAYLRYDVWPRLGLHHKMFILILLSSLPIKQILFRFLEWKEIWITQDTQKKPSLNFSFGSFSSSSFVIWTSMNRTKDEKRVKTNGFVYLFSQIWINVEPWQCAFIFKIIKLNVYSVNLPPLS
jgi:hypothetical protein